MGELQGNPDVSYQVDDFVATITMLRPSLTKSAKETLLAACVQAAGDDAVRAIMLIGTGRVFCAGQDLGEHADALRRDPQTAFSTLSEHYNPLVRTLTEAPKPVVAAINGSCAGAGISLALACDVRIAVAGARFTTAFAGIGLTFDSGLSATLARAVGSARASELIMVGQAFTAEEALAWGLVGRVCPAEELPATAAQLSSRLAHGPTRAYAASKQAISSAWAQPLPAVLEAEAGVQASLGATLDHQHAVEAFLEKRAPTFTGRE